ncbi:MAG: hypothetical protein U1E53_34085 [Dongiaceae bacterium]
MLPEELEHFIRTTIRSVWALELLLLLAGEPDRAWTEDEANRALRGSTGLVRSTLAALVQAGLLALEGDAYRFRPATPELRRSVEQLAEAHAARPLAVVRAILDAPNERIRSFADAFRVRKDGEP